MGEKYLKLSSNDGKNKKLNIYFTYAELEQAAALKYLYGWLRHHPKYGTLAPPELSDSLYYADVSFIFHNSVFVCFHLKLFLPSLVSYALEAILCGTLNLCVCVCLCAPFSCCFVGQF